MRSVKSVVKRNMTASVKLLENVNEVRDKCHYCYKMHSECHCNHCTDCARRNKDCICGM